MEESSAATVLYEFWESMTSEELSDWLLEQGIPDKHCKVFESKTSSDHTFAVV